MNIFETLITVPFGYLLDYLYHFTSNYGVALIIFAVIVRIVLLPITAKSKKSMMKMSRLQPRIQEIQRKYANDQQKQREAIQQVQKEEGVSMGCGGCLWSLLPMLILIPLISVVRYPIQYMLHESAETVAQILKGLNLEGNPYGEVLAAASSNLKEVIETTGIQLQNPETIHGLNFTFLGINLGNPPQFNIFGEEWVWDWNHIGAFLIPVLSAASQVLSMFLSQRANDSIITNKDGLEDKETAKQSQSAKTSKIMMFTMPLLTLFIGFSYPTALSLYWFIGGLVAMIENEILTRHYRKVYDAEDAVRLQKKLEADRLEEEKERLRAERRAANPDGITANTSKKKLQQKQQREEEAAKREAAKEYAAKKGLIIEEEEVQENTALSGISDRPFCKGRAYDPNHYSNNSTEE